MSILGIFGKKAPSSVTAHILDPNTGYSKQTWLVGQQIRREVVEKLSENGNVFVVVAYEAGKPKQMACRSDVWNQAKAQFDRIDAESQSSMRQIKDGLDKLR